MVPNNFDSVRFEVSNLICRGWLTEVGASESGMVRRIWIVIRLEILNSGRS